MVSKNKRELGRRAFATLAGAVLAAPHVRAETATDIRIGFANIGADNRQFSAGSTAAVAHAEGYVERELRDLPGVQVHWYFFKGAGPAVNEAFATGQLDIAFEGDLPEVIGRASGLRTRHLMASGGHGPTYLAVPPESPLTGIDSLRGKKIGLFRGTNNHLAVVKVLAAHGMTERDMQVFNMDEATSNAALVARDIDAAFGNYGPLDLAARGLAKIIYTTKGDNPAFERQGTVIASDAFATAQPELTQRIITAFVRAADFASQEKNRDAVFDIWARSGRSAQIFREDCAGQTMQYRCSPLLDDFMVEQYRVQAQQARQYGLIRRDVDVQGWFDTHFLDTALQTLGLQNAWVRYDKNGKPVAAT
jgi:sulfonate transport system substrate-binding protein